MSIVNSIYHSRAVYNCFKRLNLGLFLSDIYIRHLMAIVLSVFLDGYNGKTLHFAKAGTCHRTTISHFLNACVYFHKCRINHTGDPWSLYQKVADWSIYQELAFDKYQIRSQTGIRRYWLIMSLIHFMCCTCTGKYCSFEEGYQYFKKKIREELITNLYQFAQKGIPLEDILKMVG